jgi:putative ABC transport system permease protein
MNPLRLALRTLLLGQPRSVIAVLLIATSLCGLDLFAGHIASERVLLEYQAVIGERLGHLALTRAAPARTNGVQRTAFAADEARRVKRIAEGVSGVSLVLPQMNVTGVAATDSGSALFFGAGMPPVPQGTPAELADQPGKLDAAKGNGIAVSSGQAQTLGLRNGSAVTLTAVDPDAPPVPVSAQVVDIFSTAEFNVKARSLLMPFAMAQGLLDTDRTERLVVFLSDPKQLDAKRIALVSAMRDAGVAVTVSTWKETSSFYATAHRAFNLEFASVIVMVLAIIGATVVATVSMNTVERRRELATLRALGMGRISLFVLVAAEGLWMAASGVVISLIGSGLIAWIVNRVALSFAKAPGLNVAPMLVELDFGRMLVGIAAVLAVAAMAVLAPAVRAARADVARGLAA